MENINFIVERSVCTGCGGCAGICPTGAIKMEYNISGFLKASVDKNKCVYCGKCMRICPSNNKNMINKIPAKGNRQAYIGYACSKEIRLKSQSGGIVSAIGCYLLENKLVDGLVTNVFNADKLCNEAMLITDSEKILLGAGSYYSQSAVLEAVFREKSMRLAVILLGCQSFSLKLAEECGFINNVIYKIGLICECNYSKLIIKDLISQANLQGHKIVSFRFKDKEYGNWPGNIRIVSNRVETVLKSAKRTDIKGIYQNYRCLFCADKMNNYADIVCGDPWGISIKDKEKGYNVVVENTNIGKRLLKGALENGYILLREIDINKVLDGQHLDENYMYRKLKFKNIILENKEYFPINDIFYPNIQEKSNDKDSELKYMKELEYAKSFYEANDLSKVKKLINQKKRKLVLKKIMLLPQKILLKSRKLVGK